MPSLFDSETGQTIVVQALLKFKGTSSLLQTFTCLTGTHFGLGSDLARTFRILASRKEVREGYQNCYKKQGNAKQSASGPAWPLPVAVEGLMSLLVAICI